MPGIEDFVVEQIMNDFQQSPQAPAAQPQQPQDPHYQPGMGPEGSSFLQDASYNGRMRQNGMPDGAVSDPRSPRGFSIADPAARERYAQSEGRLAASAAGGQMMDSALRERDAQRFKILEGLKGLDPEVQGTILKRLGIDPGVVKSKLDQQKELLAYKQQLEEPQNQVANAIKMMLATQGGQQHVNELQQKQVQFEAEQQSRGQTQNIQLMRVLATLMQSDTSGKLQQTLGPLLMQLLQGSGINLAPQQAQQPGAKQPQKPAAIGGAKITRLD